MKHSAKRPSTREPAPVRSVHPTAALAMLLLAVATIIGRPAAISQSLPPSGAVPASAAEIVSSFGLRAVDRAPAVDVELQTLDGAARRLSAFEGQWVVATFFATWCGPCRSEMPSLEQLHGRWAARGVAVLGISIDRQAEVVGPFLQQLGITFPTLWDESGKAARSYKASSIPLTYLIDPSGHIVGVSRGARDWMLLEPMIAQLVALDSGAESGPTEVAAGASSGTPSGNQSGTPSAWHEAEQVELPHTFEPPTAEVRLLAQTAYPGEPFRLEIDMLWPGAFRDYLPHPPWVALPDGVEQRAISASTSSRDGANRVRYTVELAATEPGTYALDPIELRYTPLAENEPVATRIEGPIVTVSSATAVGARSAWPLAWVAVLATVAAFVWRRRQASRERGALRGVEQEWEQQLRARLDDAKRLRLEGRLRDAFVSLSELEAEIAGTELSAEAQALRYAPTAPSLLELERLEKKVDRLWGDRQNEPQKTERTQLELREQTQPRLGESLDGSILNKS